MPERSGSEIERLREADGSLSRAVLLELLPYGETFLFLDRVTRLAAEEMEATYRVPTDSPYLEGHFVGFPVMPAALIAEGFSQAASLLVRYNVEESERKEILALKIERGAFRSPVFPGDELRFTPRLIRMDSRAARLEGDARVADNKVAEFQLVLAIVDREVFRRRAVERPLDDSK